MTELDRFFGGVCEAFAVVLAFVVLGLALHCVLSVADVPPPELPSEIGHGGSGSAREAGLPVVFGGRPVARGRQP